jgi:hypothetical protein
MTWLAASVSYSWLRQSSNEPRRPRIARGNLILSVVVIDRDSEFQPPLVAPYAYRAWKGAYESLGRSKLRRRPTIFQAAVGLPYSWNWTRGRGGGPESALPSPFVNEMPNV